MGERLARIQEVRGSIPLVSTISDKALRKIRKALFFVSDNAEPPGQLSARSCGLHRRC